MIALLKGTIENVGKDSLVVMTVSGLGYEVHVRSAQVLKCSSAQVVTLYTYLKVSDSALDLYGFETIEERHFFELLMTVSGIGPKSAMHIMSAGSLSEIQAAIARGDAADLSSVQGIGKKTAERLVVELKSKVNGQMSDVQNTGASQILSEVIEALTGLGYAREEARAAVARLESAGKTTEELLKLALQQIRA